MVVLAENDAARGGNIEQKLVINFGGRSSLAVRTAAIAVAINIIAAPGMANSNQPFNSSTRIAVVRAVSDSQSKMYFFIAFFLSFRSVFGFWQSLLLPGSPRNRHTGRFSFHPGL